MLINQRDTSHISWPPPGTRGSEKCLRGDTPSLSHCSHSKDLKYIHVASPRTSVGIYVHHIHTDIQMQAHMKLNFERSHGAELPAPRTPPCLLPAVTSKSPCHGTAAALVEKETL